MIIVINSCWHNVIDGPVGCAVSDICQKEGYGAVRLFIELRFLRFLPGPEAITKSRKKAINNATCREKMKTFVH